MMNKDDVIRGIIIALGAISVIGVLLGIVFFVYIIIILVVVTTAWTLLGYVYMKCLEFGDRKMNKKEVFSLIILWSLITFVGVWLFQGTSDYQLSDMTNFWNSPEWFCLQVCGILCIIIIIASFIFALMKSPSTH